MTGDHLPILVGAGQLTQRDVDPARALEPLAMMAHATRRAADDAGGGTRLLAALDTVGVVSILSWDYRNAPRLLAEELGARPARELYTTMGGNSPQYLVNLLADRIAAGEVGVALIAGAEAVSTLGRARRARVHLGWRVSDAPPPTIVGDARPGTSELEIAHNLQLPTQIYPLFENALRARRGLGIAAHRLALGRLASRFSAVAAENPHAWFRTARTAEEIATVTPENRMIGFPYPKLMNAILDVDQAAAVLMTSAGRARALGIPEDRWVYLRGAADAHDHWFVSQRVSYTTSPAIRAAGAAALAMAGATIADVRHLDLYSCFPCAVQIARDVLGIAEDDPRPLTVTGGLAYFGGPGNAYSLHAIATMLERMRRDRGSLGLITALGWYVTKHAVGVYGAAPPPGPWSRPAPAALQAVIDREPRPELAAEGTGRATIETYTVIHDREGAPVAGTVVARLTDGSRCLAVLPHDRPTLEALTAAEGVGRAGTVRPDDGVNRFEPG